MIQLTIFYAGTFEVHVTPLPRLSCLGYLPKRQIRQVDGAWDIFAGEIKHKHHDNVLYKDVSITEMVLTLQL